MFVASPLFSKSDISQQKDARVKAYEAMLQHLPESIREKFQFLIPTVDNPNGLQGFNSGEKVPLGFLKNIMVGDLGLLVTHTFHGWDFSSQTWRDEPYQRESFTFDSNENQIESLFQSWDEVDWVNEFRTLITFDANDNQIELKNQEWEEIGWLITFRQNLTYDSNDNLIELQTWSPIRLTRRNLLTYDSNGNLIENVNQILRGSDWENIRRFLFTYDSNSNLIEILQMTWDGADWTIDERSLRIYDSNGNQTESFSQNRNGTDWVNTGLRSLRTYDSNGNQTEHVQQGWDLTNWINALRDLFTYDSNGNQTEFLHHNWDGSDWINARRNLSTYDSNDNLIENIIQIWSETEWLEVDRLFYTFDLNGNLVEYGTIFFIVYVDYADIVVVSVVDEAIPFVYSLNQNYPNPFNPATTIEYSLPNAGDVTLIIYNLLGEEVARLIDSYQPSGEHNTTWNASNVSSGIYFFRLQAGDFVQTRKMVLLK